MKIKNKNGKMKYGKSVRIFLSAGLCLCILNVGVADVAPAQQPPPPTGNKTSISVGSATTGNKTSISVGSATTGNKTSISVGNATISGYKTYQTNIHHPMDFTSTGPGIEIVSRDPANPTQFHIDHIDRLVGHQVMQGKQAMLSADMTGAIRYVITQSTARGTRRVIGIAGRVLYDEPAGQVHLIDGVNAELTASTTLDGPAKLRADRVTIPIPQKASSIGAYEIEGNATTNDITLSLLPTKDKKTGAIKKSSFAGPIHLYHFRSGALTPGVSGSIHGEGSTVDFTNTNSGQKGLIQASSVELAFDRRLLQHIVAEGSVHYHGTEPGKEGVRAITGTCASVTYSGANQTVEMKESVEADLDDPSALLEPARLEASRVVQIQTAPAQANPPRPATYRYEIEGDAGHSRLRFRVKPPKEQANSKASSGAEGVTIRANANDKGRSKEVTAEQEQLKIDRVELTGFSHGNYEPGKTLEFTGNPVTLNAANEQQRTAAQIQSNKLSAVFAQSRKGQDLKSAEAVGNVRYRFEQPYGKDPGKQTLVGDATSALFTGGAQEHTIEAKGVRSARVVRPGQQDNVIAGSYTTDLTYNLTTGQFLVASPNRDSSISFAVKQADSTKTDKKPNANQHN